MWGSEGAVTGRWVCALTTRRVRRSERKAMRSRHHAGDTARGGRSAEGGLRIRSRSGRRGIGREPDAFTSLRPSRRAGDERVGAGRTERSTGQITPKAQNPSQTVEQDP